MKKLLFSIMLTVILVCSFSLCCMAAVFTDVPQKAWYYKAVQTCAEKGIMVGTSENTFSPGEKVTRGMVTAVIGRMENADISQYTKPAFPDTKIGSYYTKYTAWCADHKIVAGYEDGSFKPDAPIARQELMAIIYRYCQYKGKSSEADISILDSYKDNTKINSYAKEAAAWCVTNKIITGISKDIIDPLSYGTRAQFSQIIYNMINTEKEQDIDNTPVPGLKTIRNLICTGMSPIGHVLYVYGGGWNEEDTGSGIETVTIGLSPSWQKFWDSKDSSYDHKQASYQIHDGLDCSGYVGWVIYNTLNTESGKEGYVNSSRKMAADFSARGWGTYTYYTSPHDFKPGDIVSMTESGHVWISLGQCTDGSVIMLQSSPPGVMLSGTLSPEGKETEATKLANYYMEKYFPLYTDKFGTKRNSRDYLKHLELGSVMRWDTSDKGIIKDPEGLQSMTAEEVLINLLGK